MDVTLLFPAGPPRSEERLESALRAARAADASLNILRPRPISPRRPDDCLDYLAGDDQARSQEILNFLRSESEKIGWFGRGGFGVTRILSQLGKDLPSGQPVGKKLWMGYSDISAMFGFVKTQKLPIDCVHGPMLCAFREQPNPAQVLDALRGIAHPIPLLSPPRELSFSGTIWGGNLAVLASLCGTDWLPTPSAEETIFLEDVEEAPYRVDRYLTQLEASGFFSKTQRVFLGTFTGFEPAEAVSRAAELRCRQLGLHVLGTLPVGHSEPHSPLFLDHPYRYCRETNSLLPQ